MSYSVVFSSIYIIVYYNEVAVILRRFLIGRPVLATF